jgi:hypothetical protein
MKEFFSNLALSLIAIFFSTPVIGLVISTLAYGFLYTIYGYDMIYYVPEDKKIVEDILSNSVLFDEDQNIDSELIVNNELKWTRKLKMKFYPYYQAKVRDYIKTEQKMEFLERRWSTYWTNINSISAIVLSVFLNLVIISSDEINRTFEWSNLKAFGLVIVCSYIFFAYRNMKRARNEAEKVERLFMTNPAKQTSTTSSLDG